MSAKLFITDSGIKGKVGIAQYEVGSPFLNRKPEEQEEIKNVGLFQIQIEKTYQTFAVGKVKSLWEWELNKEVQDSMTQEQERDDLENLRTQDLERQYDNFFEE